MWTYTDYKPTGDPLLYGTLITRFKRCGKKNCHCTKIPCHLDHYLKWREVDPFTGKRTLHRKYVRKSEVKELKNKLEIAKGTYILQRLSSNRQVWFMGLKYPNLHGDEVLKQVYQVYKKPPYPNPILSDEALGLLLSKIP